VTTGTYVYCLVAAPRRPPARRVPPGLDGLGPVRLLEVDERKSQGELPAWLVAADAPLDRYGEDAINRGLSDLDWVSRAAVAHERVIESFIAAPAVLPMKLFTIFTSDERAREHIRRQSARIRSLVRRVANHQEWGLRVILDRAGAAKTARPATRAKTEISGTSFLLHKKSARDRSAELSRRAQETVADLYDRLSEHAAKSKRRASGDLPVQGGPLLLDAAFLVAAKRAKRFRTIVGREAQTLGRQGYLLTLSGPWPPYTFVQD
jgi:Gas vesicle synthesis protein GvpL/GvpF